MKVRLYFDLNSHGSSADDEIIGGIQLGQLVKVAVDYGRDLASNFMLKIKDCSLISTASRLILVENSQIPQVSRLKNNSLDSNYFYFTDSIYQSRIKDNE